MAEQIESKEENARNSTGKIALPQTDSISVKVSSDYQFRLLHVCRSS